MTSAWASSEIDRLWQHIRRQNERHGELAAGIEDACEIIARLCESNQFDFPSDFENDADAAAFLSRWSKEKEDDNL